MSAERHPGPQREPGTDLARATTLRVELSPEAGVGTGLATLASRLRGQPDGRWATAGREPVVLLLDRWTATSATRLHRQHLADGAAVLPVRLDGSLVLVGPLVNPGQPGCLTCVERQRREVAGGSVPQSPDALTHRGVLTPAAVTAVTAVVRQALTEPRADEESTRMWAVRTDRLVVSTHPVRVIGGCPDCQPLPEDTPEAATITIAPRPLPVAERLRIANPCTEGRALREALYDWRLGPVPHVYRTEGSAYSLVTAELAGGHHVRREAGYGRADNYADAEWIALFEAVERYSSARPAARRHQLRASCAELGEVALDPASLGLHDERFFDHPAFDLQPYSPSLVTSWVYGWSFRRGQPVAVPEQVAYWRAPHGDRRFLYESSNGCGLGNCLEEAILYGLCETVERDAFLMAWYARTPLTRLAVPDDRSTRLLVDRMDAVGYDLLLFDATNDLGIPAVMSLALARDPDSGAPQAFFAAAAHPHPLSAIRGAVVETVTNVVNAPGLARLWPENYDPVRLRPMLEEPERVLTIDDHVGLHFLPEARSRYEFLLAGDQRPRHWRDVWPDADRQWGGVDEAVNETVDRIVGLGLDVVVVDQSEPWIRRRLGLYTVKVLVPGALPMTFGHVHQRIRGLDRLWTVPARLGRDHELPDRDQPDVLPHPFP